MNAPDELFKAPASNLSVEFPPDKQDERNSWDTELVAMCPLHAKRHWDGRSEVDRVRVSHVDKKTVGPLNWPVEERTERIVGMLYVDVLNGLELPAVRRHWLECCD